MDVDIVIASHLVPFYVIRPRKPFCRQRHVLYQFIKDRASWQEKSGQFSNHPLSHTSDQACVSTIRYERRMGRGKIGVNDHG